MVNNKKKKYNSLKMEIGQIWKAPLKKIKYKTKWKNDDFETGTW
jgi:hypothetical protein